MVNLERLKATNLGSVDHPDVIMLHDIDVLRRHIVTESLLNVVNVSHKEQDVRKLGRVRLIARRLVQLHIFPFIDAGEP